MLVNNDGYNFFKGIDDFVVIGVIWINVNDFCVILIMVDVVKK